MDDNIVFEDDTVVICEEGGFFKVTSKESSVSLLVDKSHYEHLRDKSISIGISTSSSR